MLPEKIKHAIDRVRELSREYSVLSEDEQKAIRAQVYRENGSFGKLMLPLMNEYIAKEKALLEKEKHVQS